MCEYVCDSSQIQETLQVTVQNRLLSNFQVFNKTVIFKNFLSYASKLAVFITSLSWVISMWFTHIVLPKVSVTSTAGDISTMNCSA